MLMPSLPRALDIGLRKQGVTLQELFNPSNCGIYQITNILNGEKYIGSSVNVAQRWSKHLAMLRRRRHYNQHLQNAWDKYGERAFSFNVVETVDELNCLVEREQHYIDTLCPGYNIAPQAGSTQGWKMTDEQREAVAKRIKQEWDDNKRVATATQRDAARRVGLSRRGKKYGKRSREIVLKHSGEKHHAAKLTREQVVQIRTLLEESNLTHREISSMFGVTRANITSINNGKSWKCGEDENGQD